MASIDVEFDSAVYSLASLNAAAYRLIGTASCQIEMAGGRLVCRLSPASLSEDTSKLKQSFIDLVTDEQLRERLEKQTEPVRNVILSLAFGALAAEPASRG